MVSPLIGESMKLQGMEGAAGQPQKSPECRIGMHQAFVNALKSSHFSYGLCKPLGLVLDLNSRSFLIANLVLF